MSDPWLSIIGIGEDGLCGLPDASRKALSEADIVFGGDRHLALAELSDHGRTWPLPFSVEPVLAERGRRVAVLASGDPFWFGVGTVLADALETNDWRAFPSPSTQALAATRLGWRMESVPAFGLHTSPFEQLRPKLADGARLFCLLRDESAAEQLADWLTAAGFGSSRMWVLEALGGPRERIRPTTAVTYGFDDVVAPVSVAIEAKGASGLPAASGLADDDFSHDGQITKRPVRALTLSALAPRAGERLWDLGAGSGSIAVTWCLSGGGEAVAVEAREDRAARIRANAASFGLSHRLSVHHGEILGALDELPDPAAVFLGGGASDGVLSGLWARLSQGTRVVANAVTLETQALLFRWHKACGGSLTKIDLAEAAPLGADHGWNAARTLVQWSVVR